MQEENNIVNIEEIIDVMPHRYPFLLVDKVKEIVKNESAVGIKNVTFNEPHFMGHFPNKPIMPGVLIVEAMAQTACILVIKSGDFNPKDKLVYFMSIESVKFRKPVVPGDVLELEVKILQNKGMVWKFSGIGRVDGKKVTEATFSAMIVDKNRT